MVRKPKSFTLSFDRSIYGRFKKHCDEHGYGYNRRLENLMARDMLSITSAITPGFVKDVKGRLHEGEKEKM